MLKIYPTLRSIKQEYKKYQNKNTLLAKIITIDEFQKKVILLDKELIDEDSRTLYLREAANFEDFKKLKFDVEFFSFLKNSTYLLKFFEELANEYVDIESLKKYDSYRAYEEDINSLKTLLLNYKKIVDKNAKTDRIFYPNEYQLNIEYIKSFKNMEMLLEGYLSKFEFKLINEISKYTSFFIKIKTNEFNKRVVDSFKDEGVNLELGFEYLINFSTKEIVEKKKLVKKKQNIEINSFENRLLQIANIKRKIYDFIKKGVAPEDIVVVLPDENFANILKNYDKENYFNFTMGTSYSNSKTYQKLKAIDDYLNESNYENRYRLTRLNIDYEKIDKLLEVWNQASNIEFFNKNFYDLLESIELEDLEIIDEENYKFTKFLSHIENLPFKKLYHLFLARISKRSVDDFSRGKITVTNLLESRTLEFEGVIIVDFNENIVPKKSKKDMFLSTNLKEKLKLPTLQDMENLQKYYYNELISNAKELSISYVKNDENVESRFLDELNINQEKKINQKKIMNILYKEYEANRHFQIEDLYANFDFHKTYLSSTMLKTFLDCKRKFYFVYIKNLKFEEVPKDDILDARNLGILLHNTLEKIYKKQNFYLDANRLFLDIKTSLYENIEKSLYLKYQIDIWLKTLLNFCEYEVENRFQKGYRVLETEKNHFIKYKEFILKGVIDRVDIKNSQIEIIDYKSGKVPKTPKDISKTTDFQLEFYYHLLNTKLDISNIYYYDLSEVKLVQWDREDEKLKLFDDILDTLNQKEFNFTKCEDLQKCRYCNFSLICDR